MLELSVTYGSGDLQMSKVHIFTITCLLQMRQTYVSLSRPLFAVINCKISCLLFRTCIFSEVKSFHSQG